MAKLANIAIVDDDQSVRESLQNLLQVLGFAPRAFSSAEEFLASDFLREAACLILDVDMDGMSGPELQAELRRSGSRIPIIFITAQWNDSLRHRLSGQEAIVCLPKPFSDTALEQALDVALQLD